MFQIVNRYGRAVDRTRYATRREATALADLLGMLAGEVYSVEVAA